MADVTTVLNDQSSWESGDLVGLTAYDPAGKLIPSVDADEIASVYDNYALAVYSRIRDGSGTSIANLGEAGVGTLTGGTWATRADDGRAYLTGGSITYAFHGTMAITDSDGNEQTQGGGLRFKLSSLSAQVLMTRSGRFTLGIDANFLPYLSWVHAGGTYTITAAVGHIIKVDTPTVLHFAATGGSAYFYKDGALVGSVTGLTGKDDASGSLTVSCTGIWSDVFLVGEYYNSGMLATQRYSGTWEKIVDLGVGKDQTLRYFTIVSKKKFNHAISIAVSFAASEVALNDSRVYSFSVDQYETEKFHAPETTLSHGRYMKVQLSLSGRDFDYQLPIVDSLTLVTRDIGTVVYEQGDLDFGAFVLPLPEEGKTPESLGEALEAIANLRASVNDIKKVQESQGIVMDFISSPAAAAELEVPITASVIVIDPMGSSPGYQLYWRGWTDLPWALQTIALRGQVLAADFWTLVDVVATKATQSWVQSWVAASFATSTATSTAISAAVSTAIGGHTSASDGIHGLPSGGMFATASAVASAFTLLSNALQTSAAVSTAIADHDSSGSAHSSAIAGHNGHSSAHSSTFAIVASVVQAVLDIANDAHTDASTAVVNASTALSKATVASSAASDAHADASTAYALADAAQTSSEVSSAIYSHNTDYGVHSGQFDTYGTAHFEASTHVATHEDDYHGI